MSVISVSNSEYSAAYSSEKVKSDNTTAFHSESINLSSRKMIYGNDGRTGFSDVQKNTQEETNQSYENEKDFSSFINPVAYTYSGFGSTDRNL